MKSTEKRERQGKTAPCTNPLKKKKKKKICNDPSLKILMLWNLLVTLSVI